MDEQMLKDAEIRALEINAARAMGWHIQPVPVKVYETTAPVTATGEKSPEDWTVRQFAYHTNEPNATQYYLLAPGEKSYGPRSGCELDEQETWNTYCPYFARGPEAILQALTWLRGKANIEITPTHLAAKPYGGGELFYSPEPLGIAICKAIASLGEAKDTMEGNGTL